MKKTTFIPTKAILILFTLLVTLSASAQEIKKSSLTADDIAEALDSLGLTIDKFDFCAVDGQRWVFEIFFDEYKNGRLVEKDYGFTFQIFIDEGKKLSDVLTTITMKSESLAVAKVTIKNGGGLSSNLPLHKLKGTKQFLYRDFDFQTPPVTSETHKIPLKLLCSYYIDEDGQTRCCDDKLLSPDFTNDIFRNSPHYYVIGLKLSPR